MSELFNKVKKSIVNSKAQSVITKDEDSVSLNFSDITYMLMSDKSENIMFKAFNLDLILNPDDSIVILEQSADGVEAYTLDDGDLKNYLKEFLEWRIRVLDKIKV